MKRSFFIFALIILTVNMFMFAGNYEGKKVLYIDSYHAEYAWSAGITQGIQDKFKDTGIELEIRRMDTKHVKDDAAREKIALELKAFIEEWKPDLVIASDDNAQEYLVSKYFLGSDIPFVFCGVNSDPAAYGYPSTNVTGMLEVALYPQMIKTLSQYAKGEKLGLLGPKTSSFEKFVPFVNQQFGLSPEVKSCATMDEWIQAYKEFQTNVDILIIYSPIGIEGWDDAKAVEIAETETLIPSGCTDEWETPYSMVGYLLLASEQGEWAAETALKIFDGESTTNIPITQNKNADLYLNLKIANKLGVVFDTSLFDNATIIK